MDPIIITKLLTVLLNNPSIVADGVNKFNQPGIVNAVQMQESLADASMGVLQCYHKSARFRAVDVLSSSWDRQAQYGAEQSEIIKIHFQGASRSPYEMVVAVMRKENSIRAAVIKENTLIPYNKHCELEHWITGKMPEQQNSYAQDTNHGWIGVALQNMTPILAESLKLPISNGVLVHEVLENSPASVAGLVAGDVILDANGELISDAKSMSKLITDSLPNQSIIFKVFRADEIMNIEVVIGEKPKLEVAKE